MAFLLSLEFSAVEIVALSSETGGGAALNATASTDDCGMQDTVWNQVVKTQFQRRGVNASHKKSDLPALSSQWSTLFNLVKSPIVAGFTFLSPSPVYNSEEIPPQSAIPKAFNRVANLLSLGIIPKNTTARQRDKVIHAQGVVAKVAFEPTPLAKQKYTGFFKSGAPCGLARFSLAIKPSDSFLFGNKFTPGMALKFYTKAKPTSVNLQVMDRLDGQQSPNFFANPFSNRIPKPKSLKLKAGVEFFRTTLKLLGAKTAADADPRHLDLDEFARYDSQGTRTVAYRGPSQISFFPTIQASNSYSANRDDFRMMLSDQSKYKSGMVLYEVWESVRLDGGGIKKIAKLGQLVLKSSMIASVYGDEILHFRHFKKFMDPNF